MQFWISVYSVLVYKLFAYVQVTKWIAHLLKFAKIYTRKDMYVYVRCNTLLIWLPKLVTVQVQTSFWLLMLYMQIESSISPEMDELISK